MPLKTLRANIEILLEKIQTDLPKTESNWSARQRIRVASIILEKELKKFRKKSVKVK